LRDQFAFKKEAFGMTGQRVSRLGIHRMFDVANEGLHLVSLFHKLSTQYLNLK
jgi:hypothetical protein